MFHCIFGILSQFNLILAGQNMGCYIMHVITPLKSWKPEAEGVCARDFLEQWNVEQALWLASMWLL